MLGELYASAGDEKARFTLEVRRSNAVAIHLYEREGFRAAGVRRRYYQDNGEDAIVMWRTPATLSGTLEDVPNPGRYDDPRDETSCDDTCAAVIDGEGRIHSNVISSQTVHGRFGGVVPEIASRHHLESVNLIVEEALALAGGTLDDIELIGATQGPGLVGALLVGLSTAKALAAARELPFAPVDHLRATSRRTSCWKAARERAGEADEAFEPPFLC